MAKLNLSAGNVVNLSSVAIAILAFLGVSYSASAQSLGVGGNGQGIQNAQSNPATTKAPCSTAVTASDFAPSSINTRNEPVTPPPIVDPASASGATSCAQGGNSDVQIRLAPVTGVNGGVNPAGITGGLNVNPAALGTGGQGGSATAAGGAGGSSAIGDTSARSNSTSGGNTQNGGSNRAGGAQVRVVGDTVTNDTRIEAPIILPSIQTAVGEVSCTDGYSTALGSFFTRQVGNTTVTGGSLNVMNVVAFNATGVTQTSAPGQCLDGETRRDLVRSLMPIRTQLPVHPGTQIPRINTPVELPGHPGTQIPRTGVPSQPAGTPVRGFGAMPEGGFFANQEPVVSPLGVAGGGF